MQYIGLCKWLIIGKFCQHGRCLLNIRKRNTSELFLNIIQNMFIWFEWNINVWKIKYAKRSNIILQKSCSYFLKYRKLSCVQTCWLNFARRNLKAALECLAWLEKLVVISGFTGPAKRGGFGTSWRKLMGPDSSQHAIHALWYCGPRCKKHTSLLGRK